MTNLIHEAHDLTTDTELKVLSSHKGLPLLCTVG